MSKKLCIVLGNGFTIDMLKHMELTNDIDVVNLFRIGDQLPWPSTNIPGFLSFKHCPNLWNLGARPHMSTADCMALLEDIITCVNAYAIKSSKIVADGQNKPNEIYIAAYRELSRYIRTLFTHYNNLVSDDILSKKLVGWYWIDYIKKVVESDCYESIGIITYNYDVWLERCLNLSGIKYCISGVDRLDTGVKVRIFKPHGSISFYHRSQSPVDFRIKYDDDLIQDASVDDYELRERTPLPPSNCIVNALIPPAGDSDRFKQSWAGQIKTSANAYVKTLKHNDEMIICGLSYWHVDRNEIDNLITTCNPSTDVYMFNPNPNRSLNAVLTSSFSNYVLHLDSSVLKSRNF